MAKVPLVSIIIPTHNRNTLLVRLIKSLLKGTYKNIEIIVVDDASSDKTFPLVSQIFRKNKRVRIIKNKTNLQTVLSKNKGISMAKGEYLFFVDDDNIASKDLITNLVRVISSDTLIGEVGPVMYFNDSPNKLIWTQTKRNMLTTKTTSLSQLKTSSTWGTDDIPNAYMIRGNILRKYNILFNGNLVVHYEESDLTYRLKKLGYRIVVVKNAKIYHDIIPAEEDTASLQHMIFNSTRLYYLARNRLIFHADFSSKIQLFGILIFWNWLFAGYYLYHILFYSGSKKISVFNRLRQSIVYLQGTMDGYIYACKKLLTYDH